MADLPSQSIRVSLSVCSLNSCYPGEGVRAGSGIIDLDIFSRIFIFSEQRIKTTISFSLNRSYLGTIVDEDDLMVVNVVQYLLPVDKMEMLSNIVLWWHTPYRYCCTT